MIALYYRLIIQKFDSAQDDTLKGLLREPRTNGRTQFAPTDEIKIFCFIAYGSSFLTVTTLDRRQLVAGTHGPYKHRDKLMLLATDQTKIYISLFTIKKKHAVASCPRVSTSH